MNNSDALQNIESCREELKRIDMLITNMLGHTSPIVPYLTKYAIIRSCGTIEYCFKAIVSDVFSGHSPQIANYVDSTIRYSSMNPSKENIHKILKKFDDMWNENFKQELNSLPDKNRVISSLNSLNSARNSFAHGNLSSSTFDEHKWIF